MNGDSQNDRSWPSATEIDVRFHVADRGMSGLVVLNVSFVAHDPDVWSGRASQENFVELVVSGLASMYPAFDWSVLLRATMDISARAISLADRPQLGHLGHQCSHAGREDRTSISSHPLADLGGQVIQLLANDHAAAGSLFVSKARP